MINYGRQKMKAKIKSKKWYGWFWPPERKKIKIMQAILDHHNAEIEKKVLGVLSDHLIYGKPTQTPNNHTKERS